MLFIFSPNNYCSIQKKMPARFVYRQISVIGRFCCGSMSFNVSFCPINLN